MSIFDLHERATRGMSPNESPGGSVGTLRKVFAEVPTNPVAMLQRLWPCVRTVSFLDAKRLHTTELKGLTAWYKRLCLDDGYTNAAPAAGIDSLLQLEETLDGDPQARLGVARWAVFLAEEVVACRRDALRSRGTSDADIRLTGTLSPMEVRREGNSLSRGL